MKKPYFCADCNSSYSKRVVNTLLGYDTIVLYCKRFSPYYDVVSGDIISSETTCQFARTQQDLCGYTGKYFSFKLVE